MEKKYKVLLNDSLFIDLESISSKYIRRILENVDRLELFPELGVTVENGKWKGYRKLIVDFYLVLYQIDEKKKTIHIRFVKHGRMDTN